MREGVPQGSVLAPLLFLFVIDDLQDHLPEGVHSSLFADDSTLWVHTPRKEDAVPVLQKGMREVYQWARAKKFPLNLKSARCPSFLQISMRGNGNQLWKSKEPGSGSIQPLCS
jgi:hypothetical protein